MRPERVFGDVLALRRRLPARVAHDSGDGEEILHCPFCGAGQVIGRSDHSAECEFCGQCFTVQVQPRYPGFPQSVNGQPVPIPGMPGEPGGGPPGIPPGGDEGAVPGGLPGAPPPAGGDPDAEGEPGDGPPEDPGADDGGDDGGNPFAKNSYRTAAGDLLPEEAYLRHLAIELAPDRAVMLAVLRRESARA
jgi:hypothetical protein